MTDPLWEELREEAVAAMGRAYAPYSNFPVGAAARVEDGRTVAGCNVENASYGIALCAECGLVSQLHMTGGGKLTHLVCVNGHGEVLMPCGRCRQLLWENGGPDCLVEATPAPLTVAELLPHAFGVADLEAVTAPTAPSVPARLASWRGRGTVFVHPDVSGGQQVWTGYWERSAGLPDGETGILEEAPAWPDVEAALAWARARTARVVVVDADGGMSWAGEGPPPAEIPTRWAGEA